MELSQGHMSQFSLSKYLVLQMQDTISDQQDHVFADENISSGVVLQGKEDRVPEESLLVNADKELI